MFSVVPGLPAYKNLSVAGTLPSRPVRKTQLTARPSGRR